MRSRIVSFSLLGAAIVLPTLTNCSAPLTDEAGVGGDAGSGVTGGAAPGGANATGGVAGTNTTGGASGSGVTGGSAGANATGGVPPGGSGGSTSGTAGTGAVAGDGGSMTGGSSGLGGSGGSGIGGSVVGGGGGAPPVPPLDCGGKGMVIENAGPPANRVNYVISGDGYTQEELDAPATTAGSYAAHIQTYMTKRFSDPIGQPYLRYRKFVNICALKIPSTGDICSGNSHYNCCGDDNSRLANCQRGSALNMDISQNLPAGFEVDWRAIVLNGSSWWNTGAALMLWSGGNRDAAGAALHEGGHGHHQLADEYGNCSGGRQVNTHTSSGSTGGKWDDWIGYNQMGATGLQDFFACDGGIYRPTQNSMMNSLFGNNPNTSFNAVSREKMIMDIWRIISNPWDSVVPPAGAVTNPTTLVVNVIDPAVVSVDWSVDGTVVASNMGGTFNVAAANLSPGSHMISARAYDNAGMDLVRQTSGTSYNRQYWATNAQKTVTWTVTIQ